MKPYRIVDGKAQYLTPEQQRDVLAGVEKAERWREQHPNRHRGSDLRHAANTKRATGRRRPRPSSSGPDRVWAAMMLAQDVATCRSVLAGRAIRAGNLDPFFLRRARRGGRLPDAETYITITDAMLDAVDEAGPVAETWPDIPERLRPERGAA